MIYLEHRVYCKVLLHVGGEHHLDHLLTQGLLQVEENREKGAVRGAAQEGWHNAGGRKKEGGGSQRCV